MPNSEPEPLQVTGAQKKLSLTRNREIGSTNRIRTWRTLPLVSLF